MKKLLVLFLCISILLGVSYTPVSAFAMTLKTDDKQIDASSSLYDKTLTENIVTENSDFTAERTIQGDNFESLINREKTFTYQFGEVYLENDSIYIATSEKVIDLSLYNWYTVNYYNSSMLMADVTSVENPDDISVTGIFVYPVGSYLYPNSTLDINYGDSNIIETLYLSSDFNTCTKIIASIDDDSFDYLSGLSELFELSRESTDELSEILIESYSFESTFKFSMYETAAEPKHLSEDDLMTVFSTAANDSYVNSKQTVLRNSYDKYTDFDGILDDYVSIYQDKVHRYTGGGLPTESCDDPIVNLIPRALFVSRNTYSYIGKEYGFFVKTIQYRGTDNVSEFILFDIETAVPYPGRLNNVDPPSVTIKPVFSGKIKYLTSRNNLVVYDLYESCNLALANIQVAGAISNIDQKNIGDAGYVASDDYGYAFNSLVYEAVGTGVKGKSNVVDLGYVETLFQAANILDLVSPNLGTVISSVGQSLTASIEFVSNYYNAWNSLVYSSMDKLTDGRYKATSVNLGNANTESMIDNYGNLIKGFKAELLDQGKLKEEEYPLLYKTSSHYFKTSYNFCQKHSNVNWDALVATEISLDIYNDNTSSFLTFKIGNLEYMDSVKGGRIDHFNEIPSNSDGGNIEESVAYKVQLAHGDEHSVSDESFTPEEGTYMDFYFTPNRTFSYVIETFNRSENADPYIKIYDSNGNKIAYNDDGSSQDKFPLKRNAKITINLTGGTMYKIRMLCVGYESGYFEFIVRKNAGALSPGGSLNDYKTRTTVQGDAVWYSFTPTVSEFYSFYTTGTVDTYMTLYDVYYNQYAFDDDDGYSRNSTIDMYLVAGKTYYLKVNAYNFRDGTFDVYVNMQRIVTLHPTATTFYYNYEFGEKGANYFRFEPKATDTYTFYTLSAEGDPSLELFDQNMTSLKYDDDGGNDVQSSITYSLTAGNVYYIKVCNYDSSAGDGQLYFSY